MGDALAIAAAIAFAVGTVLQQKGTLATDAQGNNPSFLLEILHKPVWLIGLIFQVAGWVLQAIALGRASLVVVQALTALSLVIALPLGGWLTHQHIGWREIFGALLTLGGIVLFLSAGQPQGGTNHPSAATWWTACLVILALVAIVGGLGLRLNAAEKAIMLGIAAGLAFGLQAAVTKTLVAEVSGGILGLLGSWSSYVLIITAVVGFILQQSALKTGVLAPAMASSNAVTLFASVVLGIAVYGEKLSKTGGAHPGLGILGLLIAMGGVVLLAGSVAPEASKPRTAPVPT
jgi:drug/metabolite transporter (DMT)-like permease